MKTLLILSALSFFVPAHLAAADSAADGQDVSPAASDLDTLLNSGNMPRLAWLLNSAGEGAEEKFLSSAAADRPARIQEWSELEHLMQGSTPDGKGRSPDPDGSGMSTLLTRVDPEDWHFVARVSLERKMIIEQQGRGTFFHNSLEGEESKCRTRAKRMQNAAARHLKEFPRWRVHMLPWRDPETGEHTTIPMPAQAHHNKNNEHSANCFFYEGPAGRVELVADSWADMVAPAEMWFDTFDPDFSAKLKGTDEYCGEAYISAARKLYE